LHSAIAAFTLTPEHVALSTLLRPRWHGAF
jgi:hypothetical protein